MKKSIITVGDYQKELYEEFLLTIHLFERILVTFHFKSPRISTRSKPKLKLYSLPDKKNIDSMVNLTSEFYAALYQSPVDLFYGITNPIDNSTGSLSVHLHLSSNKGVSHVYSW